MLYAFTFPEQRVGFLLVVLCRWLDFIEHLSGSIQSGRRQSENVSQIISSWSTRWTLGVLTSAFFQNLDSDLIKLVGLCRIEKIIGQCFVVEHQLLVIDRMLAHRFQIFTNRKKLTGHLPARTFVLN